jgi:N-acetylglucosaminyl-diphospho-decaprenol L-rhamnosyltransferase
MSQTNSIVSQHDDYDLSIVIVNHNGRAVLPRCLEAIEHSADGLRIESIVVDNASEDGSPYLPCCLKENVRVVCLDKNLGFAEANNIGIGAARGRYHLLLNTDCFVEPGLFRALIKCLEEHPDTAIVGPRLLNEDGALQPSCHNFPSPLVFFLEQSTLWRLFKYLPSRSGDFPHIAGKHLKSGEVDWLSGACMLVRPTAFSQVGGFDSRFFFYWEEADLCMRLRQRGWKTRFEPSARAIHLGGGSTKDAAMLLHFFRSLYRFYAKHYSRRQFVVMRAIVRLMSLFKAARLGISTLPDSRSREAKLEQALTWARAARL